ncbi:IDE, partial [Symbiodinium pilosum]
VDPLPLASISLGLGGLLAGARARHFSKTWRPWLRRGVLGAGVRVPCRALATEVAPKVLADDAEVRAPPGDPRQYRVLQLDNGLQVLLASDPKDRLGLAHFHEHMLFLGTEKFPKEDEYSKYLSEHGGDSNAFTMSEYTTYYFKVASPFLGEALDRFSQFFISPTFDPSGIEREMKAVDSESTNYSTEDGWRLLQVLKATAAEEHPFFSFDVGNLDTLGADDLDGTRKQLVEWNKTHYQAGAMKLVMVGSDSLDDLQLPGRTRALATEKFGDVPSGGGRELTYAVKPWPTSQVGRIVKCVPLKDSRAISAYWPLPPVQKYLFAKPELYLAHLLGHEGAGSLHDALNQFGWVDQLSSGTAQSFTDEQLFAINITLTPEGDAHRDEVLALLFEYVEKIRSAGPKEEIFKELASLQEIGFAHKEDYPLPDDFAATAAMALHRYPPNDVLRGPFALDEWRADVVADYLSTLTPENCLIMMTSESFREESSAEGASEQGWKPEEWYKAYYKEEPLDKDHLDQWRQKLQDALQGHPSGLKLPEPNRFIPSDFSLRATDGEGLEVTKLPMEVLPPTPLVNTDMLRLWHKVDKAFKTPREYVLAHVHTGAYDAGPEVVAMMRLFCGVVSDDLNTFSYDASVAGLGYNLEFADNLTMSVGGFNDKLPDLLKVVVERVATLLDEFETAAEAVKGATTEEELLTALGDRGQELLEKLEVQRQILLQDYKNFTREDPWSVGNYYLSQLMLRKSWHLSEYIEVLERGPDLAATAAAVRVAFSHVQVDMLVHGNVSADETKSVADTVCATLERLGAKPLKELRKKEITQLPLKSTTVFEYDLAAENPAQENCSTQVVYQVGPTNEDFRRDACVSLTCHIAHVSAFQKLRTELQLGYIVQAFPWVNEHICGFSVLVQGPREHPQKVDELIEEWLEDFSKELEAMTDEDFQKNVQALVNERTQRYSRLLQEVTRHWAEILPRRYKFQRVVESTEALKSVTKEDLITFFKEYLAKDAPSRRKLSVRVLGTTADGKKSDDLEESDTRLSNVHELRDFHGQTDFYPPLLPAEMPAAKAREHMTKAEQALKPSWVSFKFSPDHLTASMEYSQAATQFRAANMLQESADAWAKSGEMKEQLHDLFGAGRAYESAGSLCDGTGPGGPATAMAHWQKAVQCFRIAGKSDVAAKLLLKMAANKEKQGDIESAKTSFQDALSLYEDEEKDYELGDVYKSYIGFLIRSGALEDALVAMDGHIGVLNRQKSLPFAHKELLSKIVLLAQLEDTVRAEEVLNVAPVEGWFTSRECQVGCELVEALKSHDAEALAGLQKEQIFTFLQVEVARAVRQLKVAALAPREVASSPQEPVDPADLLM